METVTNKPVPNVEALRYKGTPEKPDIKIFVSHRIDLNCEAIDNPLYIPVRCGAVYDERTPEEIGGILGDDTGDNISEKRNSFGELTVLYWAWKNVKADYYGLAHYRRYLSFSDKKFSVSDNSQSQTGLVYAPDFESSVKKYKLDDYHIMKKIIEQESVLSLEAYDLKHSGHTSIEDIFIGDIKNYDITALNLTYDIIESKYPKMAIHAKNYFRQSKATFYNLFIMNKDVFDDYCNFLFGVLTELELTLDIKHYNTDKKRVFGYIGEHLLGVYLLKLQADKFKTKQLQGVFIDRTTKPTFIKPAFIEKNNAIVFSSSDFFSPYLGVALNSLVESSSKQQSYDIIVLEKEITEMNKEKLRSVVAGHTNISLRFENVKSLVCTAKFYLPENNKDLSEETYYTILVPWVLQNYNKAVVLDCDIIIKRDIAELYNFPLGDNYIGAAKEYLFHGFLNNPFINVKHSLSKYCREDLGLTDEYDYFNAGVLLLNLEVFREKFQLNELLKEISINRFQIVEQDLLNKLCCNKVVDIGYQWNLMACISDETLPQIALVTEFEQKLYEEAAKSPCILHYITQKKPWKYPELKYADEWWRCAKKTIFYEICLYRMANNCASYLVKAIEPAVYDLQCFAGFVKRPDPRTGARKFADKLLPKGSLRREFAKKILPKGSLRWRFCKQIYYIFKPQYRLSNTIVSTEKDKK